MECRLYLDIETGNAGYGSGEKVDLGGDWEALNFLFTGGRDADGSPASLLVDEWPDIGGSEACSIDKEALAAFARWIEPRSDSELLSRFDPSAMEKAGIYRGSSILADPVSTRDRLVMHLEALRSFVKQSASRRAGAIIVIA